MPEIHHLMMPHKKKINNNHQKNKTISTMTTAKFPSILTRMDNQNGSALNFSSPNKLQKSLVSDSSVIMKMKEPTDSKKETQAVLTQVHKFTALRKPSATKSVNSSKVSVLTIHCCKTPATSQLPTNINFISNGLKTLNLYCDFVMFFIIYSTSLNQNFNNFQYQIKTHSNYIIKQKKLKISSFLFFKFCQKQMTNKPFIIKSKIV
jgi:hypothetical protein